MDAMMTLCRTTNLLLALFLLLIVCSGTLPASIAAEPIQRESHQRPLNELFESFFQQYLQLPRFGNRIENQLEIKEDYRKKRRQLYSVYLKKLSEINRDGFQGPDGLNYDAFKYELSLTLEDLRFNDHLLPKLSLLNRKLAFVLREPEHGPAQLKTVKDYDNFLKGMESFLRNWINVAIANMRKGMAVGIVESRYVMEEALQQVETMIVSDVKKSPFYQPILHMPASIDATQKARLTRDYTKTIQQSITPTFKKLHTFIKGEYLPKSRTSVGMSALPGGKQWYAHVVKATTTTNLTPDEIFRIGMDEMNRVTAEMQELQQKMGFKGNWDGFVTYLEQKAPKYSNKEELVKAYEALRTTVTARLPRFFGRLPKAPYEIRPVEGLRERGVLGAYQHPAHDGSRLAVFYVDTSAITTNSLPVSISHFLHEAVPGHHLQASLQRERGDIPDFRRVGNYPGFVEGWAHYAASLGREMGLYDDPYQRFIYLQTELFKATNLVLDVAIHHKGLPMHQIFPIVAGGLATELGMEGIRVYNLIAQPGQALAYKIGQLKISAIRSKAQKALGPKFDIRAFHDELLKDGALPLELLEAKMEAWISSQRR
jgi:uncharacterized protein (DUF885 family)